MRELTKGQKYLIRKWFKKVEPNEMERVVLGKINPLANAKDLTSDQWDCLREINDTEILWQNVNEFLHNLVWEGVE